MLRRVNMCSLRTLVLCCSVLGVIGTELTLEERDSVIWGSSEYTGDESIRPFTVQWSEDAIKDLKYRLNNARASPASVTNTFQYGMNSETLKEWSTYWANDYNFTKGMEFFNGFSRFITNVQGLDIHFSWSKPEVTSECKVIPLLLMHGIKSATPEFNFLIDELMQQSKDCANGYAVEIVDAALPGAFYSSAATKPGFGAPEAATVMKNMMKRLGYDKFAVHSNDCAHVDFMMATLYPEVVIGLHMAYPVTFSPLSWALWLAGSVFPSVQSLVVPSELKNTMYPVVNTVTKLVNTLSSTIMLSTIPDTIGAALSDSPRGHLAVILNIASQWNRPTNVDLADGGLSAFDKDLFLHEISAYWFDNCFTTAARMYYADSFNTRVFETGLHSKPTPVPAYALNTEFNYAYMSPMQLKLKFPNLIGAEIMNGTGHYPAFEKPKETATSLMNFIAQAVEWHANNDI